VLKPSTDSYHRIRQGDLYRDVHFIERVDEVPHGVLVSKVAFPRVIVLTQDCDLEQDHKFRNTKPPKKTQDKYLLSVLVAPVYVLEHVLEGSHLSPLHLAMRSFWAKDEGVHRHDLQHNDLPRYHFLPFPPDFPVVSSVVDFKQYFSVPVAYLSSLLTSHFVCNIGTLYREDLSQRFAAYLSRVGLPTDDQDTPDHSLDGSPEAAAFSSTAQPYDATTVEPPRTR